VGTGKDKMKTKVEGGKGSFKPGKRKRGGRSMKKGKYGLSAIEILTLDLPGLNPPRRKRGGRKEWKGEGNLKKD